MTHDPGKEPQRPNLLNIIAADAEAIVELRRVNADMRREIGDLRSKLNRAQHKNQTLWKRIAQMEKANAEA